MCIYIYISHIMYIYIYIFMLYMLYCIYIYIHISYLVSTLKVFEQLTWAFQRCSEVRRQFKSTTVFATSRAWRAAARSSKRWRLGCPRSPLKCQWFSSTGALVVLLLFFVFLLFDCGHTFQWHNVLFSYHCFDQFVYFVVMWYTVYYRIIYCFRVIGCFLWVSSESSLPFWDHSAASSNGEDDTPIINYYKNMVKAAMVLVDGYNSHGLYNC